MNLSARLRQSRFPLLALGSLLILLIAAVAVTVLSERALKDQLAREAGAQADLLASAVSGALAFDDGAAAQDYVNAVQANPNVLAAAVYDENNRLVASFTRAGETVPDLATPQGRSTRFSDGKLRVVRPVAQAGQRLGTVGLRLLETPASQRFSRYAGLVLILGLAGLVVVILAVAQGALRRANRSLTATNLLLQQQMAEREKAEAALRQSQKMEAIGRLTGGIAHDFNNLLMVASSGVELLDRTTDPDKRRSLSEGVRQAVDRGATLTRQLLAFSRQSPVQAEVLDLAVQVDGLRFLLERSLREDIEVVIDIPPGLSRVEADPAELELALLNLAVNARDAMPNGGRLTISAHDVPGKGSDPGMVCLTVADTGVGIPEAVAARVFEPFFTTKPVGRGTGLGLSQVYGFARSSGGEVSVESREGEGSTFVLCLPRSEKALAGPRPDPVPAHAAHAPGGGHILLVEDDDAVATGVGQMLADLGYSHVRAAHAGEALAVLDSGERFDLIFSDMVMPGDMNGLALARAIRARFPKQPVVLTTGFSEAASEAAEANFRLLLKPYRIGDLEAALAEGLRSGS